MDFKKDNPNPPDRGQDPNPGPGADGAGPTQRRRPGAVRVQPRRIPSLGSFIHGRFVEASPSATPFEVRSPIDPEDVVGVFGGGAEEVETACRAAANASSWAAIGLEPRLAALSRIEGGLRARRGELALRLQREMGRPPWECQREMDGLLARLGQIVADARSLLADRKVAGFQGRTVGRPLGVVAVIGPSMLPLSTSHTHILAALAAGNRVVWKPSPLAAASAQLYAEVLAAAGLPAGVFNLLQGGAAIGAALAEAPLVDAVVFIGSTANGATVRRRLVERTDRQQILHLGAKNAIVVLEDAEPELAAYEVVTSAFLSAGQRCTAASRVLVHEKVLGDFVALVASLTASLKVGPPSPQTFMGPLLGEDRLERFLALRRIAADEGAQVIIEGHRLECPGWFITPSVHLVEERRLDSAYQTEELFGPDLAVYPIRDLEDAIGFCNQGNQGLCASLFSKSHVRWARFGTSMKAGALFWNRGTRAPSGLLGFGGLGAGGSGARGGAHAILALRREVSLLTAGGDPPEVLPGTLAEQTTDGQPINPR